MAARRPRARFWSTTAAEVLGAIFLVTLIGVAHALAQHL